MNEAQPGNFHGLPTGRLDNGVLELEYLLEAGPRLVRLSLADDPANLLAETPELGWETPHGRFSIRGGHRLWAAPEVAARTSVPDDSGLAVSPIPGGVELVGPRESPTGLRKSIGIRLAPGRLELTLHHRITNDSAEPVELAPWAITMLRPGGVAILPLPDTPADPDGLQPNRSLVLWPRTGWDDPRLQLTPQHALITSRPVGRTAKVGTFSRPGWLAYLTEGLLFVKRFDAQPGLPRADLGCNAEVYAADDYLELESLGWLQRLAPGESAEHLETWELHRLEEFAAMAEPLRQAVEAARRTSGASSEAIRRPR